MSSGKALLSFTLFLSLVHGFSFGHNSPTQCDTFTVSWTGGTAPFSLLITPVFDNPRNFSIPDSAGNSGSGSFSVQLPLPAGQQFVAAMSDATGFGTGGVSDLLTVGSSVSRAACSTEVPATAFQFQLPPLLQQCGTYTISAYDGAAQPVTITGLIPHGKPIQLHPPAGPSSFVWNPVNVPTGTGIIFFLTDAAGKFGGSSHVNEVGSSNDNTCINDQSPMSTADPTSAGPTPTGDAPSPSPSSATNNPTATVTQSPVPAPARATPGTIGGAVAGGLVALLVVGTLAAFFFNKYRPRKRASSSRFSQRFGVGRNQHGGVPSADLFQPNSANPLRQLEAPARAYGTQATPWTTFPSTPGADYIAEPWTFQHGASTAYSHTAVPTENGQSESRSDIAPFVPAGQPGRSSKSPMGPLGQRPTRLILHTDAEETELPPQYSDRSAHPDPHWHPSPS